MSQVILEINHLKKSFGANQVLKDIRTVTKSTTSANVT